MSALSDLTHDEVEVLFDVSVHLQAMMETKHLSVDSRSLPQIAHYIACKFQAAHSDTDWGEVDYLETVDDFTENCAVPLLTMNTDDLWLLTAKTKETYAKT